MSLDVSLIGERYKAHCRCECGHEHMREARDVVFEANITHNLNRMADEAGIYKQVWRPEECGITTARQMIKPLREGLARLKAEPDRFKLYDAANGWHIQGLRAVAGTLPCGLRAIP